jgi:hypothetical protein
VWEGGPVRRVLGRLSLDWIPKHLVTPDERIFWVDKATTRAKKLIKEGSFNCLYTTGPPFSILLGGLWLKRQIDIPWLAEFRDPWTLAPYQDFPNAMHRKSASDVEAELAEKADAIVMVTPGFTRMMQEKYPAGSKKIFCVPNGFEFDDFDGLQRKGRNESFTVVASGTVFGRYNMNDFVSGLEEMKRTASGSFEKMKVRFQGLSDYRLNRRLLESGLNTRCESVGFVNHAANIRDLVNADLLVITLAKVKNSEGHIPSRIYEYLASGTKILAICPDGDLKELIRNFPCVTILEPGDIDAVRDALVDGVRQWEAGVEIPEIDKNVLRGLTRKARAADMDAILSSISGISKGAQG